MAAKYKKNLIPMGGETVAVYATPKISSAFAGVTEDMTVYQGVKLVQILEAIYEQGKKDGARLAFEKLGEKIKEAEKLVPHRNPGKPKKK
jgi:hypothetical protein